MNRYDLDAIEDSAAFRTDVERAEAERASDWRADVALRPAHDLSEWDPSDSEGA